MMRIKHNIAALNAHRNLVNNNDVTNKTLQRLSSGMKINQAADGPASLVVSEKLRAQIGGLRQAIDNSETGIAMVQTAEGALNEVSASLVTMRQLAVHAANEAVNDDEMLHADQEEINNILNMIDRISQDAQYGKKHLLDGSRGANGVTSGANLEFVSANEQTKGSGLGGYKIEVVEAARRSKVTGTIALTNEIIDRGEQITIEEDGKTITFNTLRGETVEANLNALKKTMADSNIAVELVLPNQQKLESLLEDSDLRSSIRHRIVGVHNNADALEEVLHQEDVATALREVGLNAEDIRTAVANITESNEPQFITLRHQDYGSNPVFSVTSTTAGLVAAESDVPQDIRNGRDVAGKIQGEVAFGKGQVLKGGAFTQADGLEVVYTGSKGSESGEFVGSVTVTQNSMYFQVGANSGQTATHSIREITSKGLARAVENLSGFKSLADLDVRTTQGAQDAIRLIDKAIQEVSGTRSRMGAFHKNNLQSNLNYLRSAHENVTKAESVIRDTDVAEEMTLYTRNQIMMEANVAMLAQANQAPSALMRLLQ
jgi:flagellin